MASSNSTLPSPSNYSGNLQDHLLLTSGASSAKSNGATGSESLPHQETNSATLASVSPPLSPPPSVETSGTHASLPVLNAQAAPLVYNSQAPVEASDTQAPHHVPAPPLIATQAPLSQFVPSLGSWAKPLIFKPPVTPPDPSTPRGYEPALIPKEKMPPPELKADGTVRFPWAARLGPQSRNLYRAASPTYRLDGTPELNDQETTTSKVAPSSGSDFVTDHEPLFVSSDVSTESQVAPAASPSLITSTAILADVLSAHAATTTPIMETVPSNNIIKEVQKTSVVDPVTTTPNANTFESPSCFSVLGDVDEAEIEPMGSLSLTRGGRETKPPIKYQDLEWKTLQGRGKHGPRGRGSKR
ncbi:hypothetical protein IGI04_021942 [Brassica rapa subsp. trilocularis]|uniref:Uncharacterized protein n=1 Tax=Brassica rapa subsp. trilocularis TaxID=1813537 RepID=A0ABQ7M308_BRACM|nr:hypothetical protein IGI04_021942 [Brassica rapa subsp. trilocularis]